MVLLQIYRALLRIYRVRIYRILLRISRAFLRIHMTSVKPVVVVELGGGHVRGCMNEWAYI